jgi:hypothetical protein
MDSDSDDLDCVDLKAWTGEIRRFVEQHDGGGWWALEGSPEGWGFTTRDHGDIVAFDPPGGPFVPVSAKLLTRSGRWLVVDAIRMSEGRLSIKLLPA